MSATDTIRAMLDERGVEWMGTGDGSTLIPAQAATNVAWDVNTWPSGKDIGGCLWVQNRHPLTPEQAIEATLGRGECHMRLVYEEEDADGFVWPDHYECSVCGASVNGIMTSYDTEVPPRFCPNCGRKVRA